MKKTMLYSLLFAVVFTSVAAIADVTQEQVTQLKFTGALGTVMRLMGGNRPIKTTSYLKDNVQRTDSYDKKDRLTESHIIDLDKEVFITLNHQKKRYSQMTFEEWREMMQESMDRAAQKDQKAEPQKDEVDITFDVDVKKTGNKQQIAGYPAEEVVLTLTLEGESKTKDRQEMQKGRLIVTSTQWLTQSAKGQDEIAAFGKKLMAKLGFTPGSFGMQQVVDALMQSNPELGEAMEKLEKESKELEGLPLKSSTVYETESDTPPAEAQAEEEETEIPTSVGGLLGGLSKKMAQSSQQESGPAVLMESESEVTKLETSELDAELFRAPDNYKEVKAR